MKEGKEISNGHYFNNSSHSFVTKPTPNLGWSTQGWNEHGRAPLPTTRAEVQRA